VQAGDGTYRAIETYQIGDNVLACGKLLNWQQKQVVFSQGTTGVSRQKYTVLVLYKDKALAVTSDHLFLMSDRTLKRADRLAPGDLLVDPSGQPVPISSVHIGDYTAGFHHIATGKKEPPPDLDGHLINTNGVVSADYAAQLFARTTEPYAGFNAARDSLPIVGSPEYIAKYGRSSLQTPQLVQGFGETGYLQASRYDTRDLRDRTFIPAEQTILKIPDDAHSFISEAEAALKALDPMRPWNDPLSREWTEYLMGFYSSFYPNVVFHNDWADNTVNAYAWVDNGVRNVAIKGGLVRHNSIELEAIALVLAHELGHHYAGMPDFPSGLSCEGESDYYGGAIIMRKIWFAEQYNTMMTVAIDQMANFFGVPNDPTVPGGSAGCNHPPGACRVATYHSAVTLGGKPGCAS
jgi:hypothetical protein